MNKYRIKNHVIVSSGLIEFPNGEEGNLSLCLEGNKVIKPISLSAGMEVSFSGELSGDDAELIQDNSELGDE